MKQTSKYHFPQWDPEDKILRTDFNQFAGGVEEALKQIIKTHNARIFLSQRLGNAESELSIPYSFIPWMVLACGNKQWFLVGHKSNYPLAGSPDVLSSSIEVAWRSQDLLIRHRGSGPLPWFSDTSQYYYFLGIVPWEI